MLTRQEFCKKKQKVETDHYDGILDFLSYYGECFGYGPNMLNNLIGRCFYSDPMIRFGRLSSGLPNVIHHWFQPSWSEIIESSD